MPEELDPNKYHVFTKKQKTLSIAIILSVILLLIPVIGFYYYDFAINRPSQTPDENTIEIERGESVSQISKKLYQNNVINSEFLFLTYIRINNLQDNLQAGVYKFPAGISIVETSNMLQRGKNDKSITFIEGWRLEEIARHASENFENVSYEKFILEGREYEGELFPDTYYFNNEVTEKEIIEKMKDTFDAKTANLLTEGRLVQAGLTRSEAIVFASILEREINIAKDKPIVAGILIKRWRNEELVGADATTQYAVATIRQGCSGNPEQICPKEEVAKSINWWPTNLTVNELQLDHPYNTRRVLGIPPSPISNPGLSSIEAVLNPISTEYNYYLSDNDGITRYAETLEQHNQNVATYLY